MTLRQLSFRNCITAAGMVALLSSCAEPSNKVQASYVSPLTYDHLTCRQLKEEAGRVAQRAATVSGQQTKQADADAVATGVALVVFWPAVFFIKGNKQQAAELASLKGQIEAIEAASNKKRCGIVFQTVETKSQAQAAADMSAQSDKEKQLGIEPPTAAYSSSTSKEPRQLTDKEKALGF